MHMSFKKKVLLSLIIPIFALLSVSTGSMYYFKEMNFKEIKQLESNNNLMAKLDFIKINFGTMIQEWKNVLLRGKSAKAFKKYSERIPKRHNEILKKANEIKGSLTDLKQKKNVDLFIDRQTKLFNGYMASMNKNLLPDDYNVKQADKDVKGLDRGALKHIGDISSYIAKESAYLIKKSESKATKVLLYFCLGVGLLSLVLITFTSIIISKINDGLLSTSGELSHSAERLKSNSDILSKRGGVLAESVSEQASSLQETVATVNEISSMINKNARGAESSLEIAKESMSVAKEGRQTVNKMITSINDIKKSNSIIMDEMAKSNDEISEIVKVILEIGEKTKVINDIVFQTKLLSFNASVEAARAGEHGKGFSVVAEEVGNLASMSGQSASEISDMIDVSIKKVTSIVEKTKVTVGSLTEEASKKASLGTDMANQCGSVFENVLQNVVKVNEVVEEISIATQEQANGVEEINRAVSQLDEVTQQSANIATEASKIANDVNEESFNLTDLSFSLNSIIGAEKTKEIGLTSDSQTNVLKFNTESSTKNDFIHNEAQVNYKKVSGDEFDNDEFEDL